MPSSYKQTSYRQKLLVCHIISGDLWGGAEAQVFSMLQQITSDNQISVQVIVFNSGELADKLLGNNITHEIISESNHGSLFMMWKIFKRLRSMQPDIVHCHGFKENLTAGIGARLLGIPVVRTHHGVAMLMATVKHRLIEKFNYWMFTSRVIAVSKDLEQILITNGFKRKNIVIILNGFNPQSYAQSLSSDSIRSDLQISNSALVIGTAGRLTPIKGQQLLLEACTDLIKQNKNIYLMIVGDGPIYETLHSRARELGILDHVIFTGFKQNVLDYINTMDIFVLPSLHEGIPIAILEAMYLGKAIIASNVGGIPEIIKNNIEGILVRPNDQHELANSLRLLAQDHEHRMRIGNNAQQKLKSRFTIEQSCAAMISEYKKLV